MKTAVCTPIVNKYNFAKESNNLHLCRLAACRSFTFNCYSVSIFFVFHTWHTSLSFSSKFKEVQPARTHGVLYWSYTVSRARALGFTQQDIQLQMTKAWTFYYEFVFTGVSTHQKCVHLHHLFKRGKRSASAPVGSVYTKHLHSQYQKKIPYRCHCWR